jgi:hypothetical protein
VFLSVATSTGHHDYSSTTDLRRPEVLETATSVCTRSTSRFVSPPNFGWHERNDVVRPSSLSAQLGLRFEGHMVRMHASRCLGGSESHHPCNRCLSSACCALSPEPRFSQRGTKSSQECFTEWVDREPRTRCCGISQKWSLQRSSRSL